MVSEDLSTWRLNLERLMQSEGVGRSLVAALAFLVWDVLIMFDDETTYLWMTKFQPLKFIYIFTRYYPVIVLIILNARSLSCYQWIIAESISAVALEVMVEILLILRLYALYTANKRLLWFIIPLFVVQIVIMVVTLSITLPGVIAIPNCAEVIFPIGIIAYCLASILFEGFLFTLTLMKYCRARSEGWAGSGLVTILVRDGVWAFALIFIANVANALFFTMAPGTLAALGFPWLLAILGSLGPRLVINIRREHQRLLPDSLDDVRLSVDYARVSTDDSIHIEEPTKPSRVSFGSWKSRISWNRSSLHWMPKASERHP